MSESERGSALPFIVMFVVLTATLIGGELRLARILVLRASAQNAADAVALAAVTADEGVARQVAAANKVQIDKLQNSPSRSTVRVRAGTMKASAEAVAEVDPRAPALRAVLSTAAAVLKGPVPVAAEGVNWIETDAVTSGALNGRSDVTGLCPAGGNRWIVCQP